MTSATLYKTLAICLFAIAIGIWTYACTRGPDGELVAAVVGFGVLGAIYWLAVYRFRPVTLVTFLWHLAIFGVAIKVGVTINRELDEMGTILTMLIPSMVLAIVAGGILLSRIPRKD